MDPAIFSSSLLCSVLTIQNSIMRIICLPATYSVFSLLSLIFYTTGQFFDPIPKLYDTFVVASFFQLAVYYAAPEERTRHQFFVSLERRERRTCRWRTKKVHDRGSLRWFKVRCSSCPSHDIESDNSLRL